MSLDLWVGESEFGPPDKERQCYDKGRNTNFLPNNTRSQHDVRNIMARFSKDNRGLQWAVVGDKGKRVALLGRVNWTISPHLPVYSVG